MIISCAFAPGPETPEHIALAEQLGYRRAWVYDSSALYVDMWSTIVQAAERTDTIGLCSGVAIPALRHVTVTASAILTASHLAPGRITLGLGAGGTGMMMLGQKSVRWKQVIAYANAVRALLRGETVDWDGSAIRLAPAWGSPLPLEIPLMFGAEGPRGEQAAREHADGVFSVFRIPTADFDWSCRLVFGTVLDDGESATSDRAFEAAAPGAAAHYHFAYQSGNHDVLNAMPGGADWGRYVDTLPARERYLAVWEGHVLRLSDHDRRYIPREPIVDVTCTGTADHVRAYLKEFTDKGVTEIVYQPSGPDIPRELRAFAQTTITS